jgi:hypothetical protein
MNKDIWDDVTIVIRSAREEILTLQAHPLPKGSKCVIVASKQMFAHHRDVFSSKQITVVRNPGDTLASSAHACYREARETGKRPFFFRMDDELPERFFNGMKERVLEVEYVIRAFYRAARTLKVSLVGPASTSNMHWLQPKMIRSWAGISGAAMLCRTPMGSADKFIDPSLRHFDDIYESCSHRANAGAVGRCQFIGGNKMATTGPAQTTVKMLNKTQGHAVRAILKKWSPDFIYTDGWSFYQHNTEDDFWVTVNWKFKRHPGFTGGSVLLPKKEVL